MLAGLRHDDALATGPLRASAGVEVRLGAVEIAYALAPGDELGTSHMVSLGVSRAPRGPETVDRPAASTQSIPPPSVSGSAAPTAYVVWGGVHRSPESAAAEVRSLRVQKVRGAEVVALDDGHYRVRIARQLSEEAAEKLARHLNAVAEPE